MKKTVYITTAIPYVNAPPHIGHALEFVQTDVIARYYRSLGKEAILLSGSDENALKNVQAAEEAGVPVQTFVDKNAKLFEELARNLNVQFDIFQKGSDQKSHFPSSQKLWRLCAENGDIYKKEYQGLYCVGCETFYTEHELDENLECYEHPGRKLDKVSETNYFFRLSKYQKELSELVVSDKLKIYPESRKNEVLSFLKQPLLDISISRTNQRARNWGVPVPGDQTQRIYVWFDALNIYQSGIGFGWDEEKYKKWWPAEVHVIGKGIIRFHAIYWPAFLLSAKLSIPKSLLVHGYITVDGQKMSKTLGNVIDPFYLLEKYGVDPLRYYFLREIPTLGDGDFSESRMQEIYESDLANELGNLVSRVTTLAEKEGIIIEKVKKEVDHALKADIDNFVKKFEFSKALEYIWRWIKNLNKKLDRDAPWKKSSLGRKAILIDYVNYLYNLGQILQPFLPETSDKIIELTRGKIKKAPVLFLKS